MVSELGTSVPRQLILSPAPNISQISASRLRDEFLVNVAQHAGRWGAVLQRCTENC